MNCKLSLRTFSYILIATIIYLFWVSLKDIKHRKTVCLTTEKKRLEYKIQRFVKKLRKTKKISNQLNPGVKYILQWTPPKIIPFILMGKGHRGFIKSKCKYRNCYVTSNRKALGDYTKFDVIAFHGPELVCYNEYMLPIRRSPHQKYAFVSMESSDNYPICAGEFNNFFNWTWTYKLNSDVIWGHMIIRDLNNNIIGPNTDMHWMKLTEMDPVDEEFKKKLETKTRATAWFVSHCYTKSGREKFVVKLNNSLKKYNLSVDVYGDCGTLKCSLEEHDECKKMIANDYYFYLSFENSFAEDYVTEKLLHALQNNAVPIVYGSANYSRFMPDGAYLNAIELGIKKLAYKINELILNLDLYAEFFRWRNHYRYYPISEEMYQFPDLCGLCANLNNEDLVKNTSTYPNFSEWWNTPYRC